MAPAARDGALAALLPEAGDTASEAEGAEADLGPAAPLSARRPISRCAFTAAVAAALSALLCLAVRAEGQGRPLLVRQVLEGMTSLTILQDATSCRNKDEIGLRTANASTLEECVRLCNGEQKCNGVLWHDDYGCDHMPEQFCFLYQGTCDPIGHTCWERVDGTTITITTTKISATKNVVFFNEILYSSDKPDGPGVEIAGPDGTDLSDYAVVVYNQAGEVEQTVELSGALKARNQQDYGIAWQALRCQWYTAVALARGSDVVNFISVLHAVTARSGPAKGRTSTVIVDAHGAPLRTGALRWRVKAPNASGARGPAPVDEEGAPVSDEGEDKSASVDEEDAPVSDEGEDNASVDEEDAPVSDEGEDNASVDREDALVSDEGEEKEEDSGEQEDSETDSDEKRTRRLEKEDSDEKEKKDVSDEKASDEKDSDEKDKGKKDSDDEKSNAEKPEKEDVGNPSASNPGVIGGPTPVGPPMSLQLYGTGLSESAFAWRLYLASPGQVNSLQNFM